jgi:hypothetical protein
VTQTTADFGGAEIPDANEGLFLVDEVIDLKVIAVPLLQIRVSDEKVTIAYFLFLRPLPFP